MNAALEQMSLGLQAVALNNADLCAKARGVAISLSNQHSYVTIDMVRQHPDLAGWQPSSPNMWGVLFIGPHWKFMGYEQSKRVSNHARRIGRWQYCAAAIGGGK